MDQNNSKRRALGRGLEELFNIEDINYGQLEEHIMETSSEEEVRELPLSEIRVNPYQPRKTFDEAALNDLAESIKEHGVIQPIIVKKSIKGYEIVAGERGFRASKIAGKETIPAIVREFNDSQMMEIAVLENLQREDLNAIEEAEAYHTLQENLGLNQEELAKRLGKSRSHITNMLGLLNLPSNVKKLISENKISMGHARVLSKLDDEEKINFLVNEIITKDLSVRDLEQIASQESYTRKNKVIRESLPREYVDLEGKLSDYFGTKVKVDKKKIEIKYTNIKDLNRILDMLNYKDN